MILKFEASKLCTDICQTIFETWKFSFRPQKGPLGPKRKCRKGPLRVPSTLYGCIPSRHTVWKCFWHQSARPGRPWGSGGAKKGLKNEIFHILAISSPRTGPGGDRHQNIKVRYMGHIHIMCLVRSGGLYDTTGAPKRARFSPSGLFWGPEAELLPVRWHHPGLPPILWKSSFAANNQTSQSWEPKNHRGC